MANKDEQKDKLLDHNYDGIKEYDNDLPRWWLNIFWITTIYALFYVGYMHFGLTDSAEVQLAKQMAELEEAQKASQVKAGPTKGVTEEELAALLNQSAVLSVGQQVYSGKCAVCHGQKGEGLIGPNMTDDYWLHGGALLDIRRIVSQGVLDKGMLAWQGVLSEDEINAVTVYLRSLRGSNPPNSKPAQGELYPGQ